MTDFDSVLLIAFGGPTTSEDIRPFLERVTAGRGIPAARVEEVAHHYELIGGRSPLNALTFRQAEALRDALEHRGRARPVYVGMRNWHPFLEETLEEMRARGQRRALGIVLSSLVTEASWARYQADVAAARAAVGRGAPAVAYAPPWSQHPRFIETMAERAREAVAAVDPGGRAQAVLVFTAHSVPTAMAKGSPYAAQFEVASRAVAERLGRGRFALAYQSRSGAPDEPWLEPDIGDAIRALAAEGVRDVVAVPIGFVCDHVEVLYDLDVEARAAAAAVGIRLHRAGTASDHPVFIEMLADLVRRGPACAP